MAKYKALVDFTEPGDGIYREGDDFPRKGSPNPDYSRLDYLLGSTNNFGKPVIEVVPGTENLREPVGVEYNIAKPKRTRKKKEVD